MHPRRARPFFVSESRHERRRGHLGNLVRVIPVGRGEYGLRDAEDRRLPVALAEGLSAGTRRMTHAVLGRARPDAQAAEAVATILDDKPPTNAAV